MPCDTFCVRLRQSAEALGLSRQTVVVAVSGGADSVALLRGLVALRGPLAMRVTAAHLNHRLRGAAADADAAWIVELCRSLDVPLSLDACDVARIALESRRGIEETARDARYAFLAQAAAAQGARHIAVAHTANDQAETVLHHVLRGTGLAGLAGIPAVRELEGGQQIVRPLLSVTRVELVEYLNSLDQSWCEDATNDDPAYTRNRLRNDLLPRLERDFNPQVIEALVRLSQHAAQAQLAITTCAEALLDRAIEQTAPRRAFLKWQELARHPRHLVCETLMALFRRQNWPRQEMSLEHWERLAGIAIDGGAGDFPGRLRACRSGRQFSIDQGAG